MTASGSDFWDGETLPSSGLKGREETFIRRIVWANEYFYHGCRRAPSSGLKEPQRSPGLNLQPYVGFKNTVCIKLGVLKCALSL